jgi:hypothetical protein
VSPFVEECLSEWRRLGVPDTVANEMAADLDADLAEAEAEGASAEEVLGSGAFDARSFAAAWATERGVIPSAPSQEQSGGGRRARSRVPAVIAAFAVVAIVGAVLAIVAHPSQTARLAVPATFAPQRLRLVVPPRLHLVGPRSGVGVPRLRIMPPRVIRGRAYTVSVSGSGWDLRPIGVLLLIVGLVGTIVSTVYRFRTTPATS